MTALLSLVKPTVDDANAAIRWSEATGTQTVVDWIVDQGGAVAEGYELTNAFGVSADGKIIAGNGTYEDKNTLWLARESTPVVEPTTPVDNANDTCTNDRRLHARHRRFQQHLDRGWRFGGIWLA